ncbi:MAG: SMC-Scp complex subunit ScpB [Casimicrobiaceae bacterium]
MSDLSRIKQVLEAALLTSTEPLTYSQLGKLFEPAVAGELVRRVIDELCGDWSGRGIELVQVATGWRFQSKPDMQAHLDRLSPEKPPKYSRSTMETLAIIAYRQPVTRADIEAIRGVVVASEILRRMEERQWIEVVGHREAPGRPALYATTRTFLDDLGLRSLFELPPLADLDHATQIELTDARQPYTPTLDAALDNQTVIGDGGTGAAAGSGESSAADRTRGDLGAQHAASDGEPPPGAAPETAEPAGSGEPAGPKGPGESAGSEGPRESAESEGPGSADPTPGGGPPS